MRTDPWEGKKYLIRRERLAEAREKLGITEPVELAIMPKAKSKGMGQFEGWSDGVWWISLDASLTADEASDSLWHELAHVMQAERAGGMDSLITRFDEEALEARLDGPHQRRFFRNWAYDRMPLEREAEAVAREWRFELQLAEKR